MTKHYLTEIDSDYLLSIGIKTIPTKIYDKGLNIKQINKDFKNLSNYILKPVSGELSNSLYNLSYVKEENLRYKEKLVQGWVIQPIIDEIRNGEYQMMFLGNELIYSQKKQYSNYNSDIPNQKDRILVKYNPTQKEINTMKQLIMYFSRLYNIKIDICRVDFMKDYNNTPILLEFEMVNPGFFIGYMESEDEDIIKIINNIVHYCENNISINKNIKCLHI